MWTAELVVEAMRAGEKIRWLPKSVIYNKVRGANTRMLFVGKRMLTNHEEREVSMILFDLVKAKRVRSYERGNIGYYDLLE